MLTEKQYEIGDNILNVVNRSGGRCNMDQYYNALPDYDNHTMDYELLKDMLLRQYHAIEYLGHDEYWLMITREGQNIAAIGLKKYLQNSTDKEKLGDTKLKLDVYNGCI